MFLLRATRELLDSFYGTLPAFAPHGSGLQGVSLVCCLKTLISKSCFSGHSKDCGRSASCGCSLAREHYNSTSGVASCLCWLHSGKSAIHVYSRIRCRVLIGHWQSSVVFVVSKELCHEKFCSRALAWNPLYVARDFQVLRSRERGSTTRILKRFWSSRICSVLKLGDFLGRSSPTSLSPNRSSKLFSRQ